MAAGLAPLLLLLASLQPPAARDVLVGVAHAIPEAASAADMQQDVERIRRAGFNLLVLPAVRGNVDRLVGVAVAAGLTVRAPGDGGSELTRLAWPPGPSGLHEARLSFWRAIGSGARTVYFAPALTPTRQQLLTLGETAGVVTRNQAVFAGLRPRAAGIRRIDGGEKVEIRVLESAETLVILGLNEARSPRTVTVHFDPDIPEAIWQNFETGTSVSFVMGREGPVFEHTFAPRDALVLMVRKRYRR